MQNKLISILCLFLLIIGSGLCTGCSSAARILGASSTKIEVRNGPNGGITIVLPKELDATNLSLSIDPSTRIPTLKAKTLKSSSRHLIESAGAAQANAIASLSETVATLAKAAPNIP